MKHWLIRGSVLVAAVLLLNGERTAGMDVGRLAPAQVLWVDESAGIVSAKTDTGQLGRGKNVAEVVSDMEGTAVGQVFLDTTEYLLITPSALGRMPELPQILRTSCRICVVYGEADLGEVADYLSTHKPNVTLGDWRKGNAAVPLLFIEEERMYLGNP